MSYFRANTILTPGKTYTMTGAEARHIAKSRRIAIGESIHLQDSAGNRFLTMVAKVTPETVTVTVVDIISRPPESPLHISLFQAAVKEKSLDNILQKTTELGVASIGIWNAAHSPEKINPKFRHKLARWQKIIDEACKQSDRERGPSLDLLPDLSAIMAAADQLDVLLVLDSHGTSSLEAITEPVKKIGIVVGPEGGLETAEIEALSRHPHTKIIKFGPRILRADTAAIAAVAILQQKFGDLN